MRASKVLVFVSGLVVGGVLVSAAGVAEARTPMPPKGAVTSTEQLCTRVSPNGKARATPLILGQNAYVGRLELDAGAKVPVHRDPTEEFIHVLAGSGSMVIDGVTYPVRPGDTVYMPANAEVSFENGPTSTVALQVFAGPAPALKYDSWTGCGSKADAKAGR